MTATAGRGREENTVNDELPSEEEVRALRREQIRERQERMQRTSVERNRTATIENQGNLGQAPLNGRRETAEEPPVPEEPVAFSFRKSNCYGDCEAYTFDLRSGGLTSLVVDKGEIARGLYKRQLFSVDYDQLNNEIDSLSGLDLAPLYPVGEEFPDDIPFREVTLFDGEQEPRVIRVYYGAPPALERFMDRLELLIEEQSWEKTTEDPTQN